MNTKKKNKTTEQENSHSYFGPINMVSLDKNDYIETSILPSDSLRPTQYGIKRVMTEIGGKAFICKKCYWHNLQFVNKAFSFESKYKDIFDKEVNSFSYKENFTGICPKCGKHTTFIETEGNIGVIFGFLCRKGYIVKDTRDVNERLFGRIRYDVSNHAEILFAFGSSKLKEALHHLPDSWYIDYEYLKTKREGGELGTIKIRTDSIISQKQYINILNDILDWTKSLEPLTADDRIADVMKHFSLSAYEEYPKNSLLEMGKIMEHYNL